MILPIQLIRLKFNRPYPGIFRSRCGSVGLASELQTSQCGAQIFLVARNLSFPERQDRALAPTQPPIYRLSELFPGVKRPEHEVNPLNTEFNPICHLLALLEGAAIVDVSLLRVTHIYLLPRLRMNGATPLLPLYAFMVWTGKNFTFHILPVALRV